MLPRAEFEQSVAAALDDLPPFLYEKMSNVEVIVAAWPTREDLRAAGVPLTQRGSHYQLTLPDRIAIFQGLIEMAYQTPAAIREGVKHTRIHKIAQFPQKNQPAAKQYGAS